MIGRRRLDKIFRENSREADVTYSAWNDILKKEGVRGHDYNPLTQSKDCWWMEGLVGMKFHVCFRCGAILEFRGFGPDADDTCDMRLVRNTHEE